MDGEKDRLVDGWRERQTCRWMDKRDSLMDGLKDMWNYYIMSDLIM